MKTKTKKQKRWVEKTKKRAVKEIVKKEVVKEILGDLPDLTLYPRAEQPVRLHKKFCKHCKEQSEELWGSPEICVLCLHKLDGSERKEK